MLRRFFFTDWPVKTRPPVPVQICPSHPTSKYLEQQAPRPV